MSTEEGQRPFIPIPELLAQECVCNILRVKHKSKKDLIVLATSTTLKDALSIMSKYKVQATPIRDDETGDVIGWLDQLLIMDFMLRLIAPNPSPTISWATHWGQPDFSASLEQKFTALERETCGGLMKSKMSEVAKFYTVLPSTSLKTLVDTFFHREVHRVGVVNEGQILVDVVTQSDVVAFLARYANSADPVMHSTIQTLELGFPRYNWVDSSAPLVHAFYLIHYYHVPAIAVVDKDGYLTATVTRSDIKRIGLQNVNEMIDSVGAYTEKHKGSLLPPLTIRRSATLGSSFVKMAMYRVHQLFIIGADDKPAGILTLPHLMQFVHKLNVQG